MKVSRIILATLVVSVAALLCCTKNVTGGGGTEWEAKLSGRATYDGSGLPAAGAMVTICSDLFLKDTSTSHAPRQTMTDKNGYFSIDRLEPGIFHVEVNDNESWATLSKCEIQKNDTVIAVACALKPTSRISGTIELPAGYHGGVYVQIYGLDRIARVALDGTFALNDIPQGDYTLRILPSSNEYIPKDVGAVTVATSAEINIGSIAVSLNDSAWSYKKLIYFNTTASGANVLNNVTNFPVMLRLTSSTFNFSQAKANGEDVRFTKADGTPLPYEVERWDLTNSKAEIWVKVDTVYGNNNSQYIVMHWGSSPASSVSNSSSVFDTANGFQGVWHLSGNGSAVEKDATGNHYDGTPSDTVPASMEGAIGSCRSFNGLSNGIRMNGTADSKLNYQENGIYTVSAWVCADTLDNSYHMIAGKGNEQYFLGLKRSVPDTTMRWEFVEYHNKEGWQITQEFPLAKTWTYLVGVRSGTTQYLFVNGVLADSTIEVTPPIAPRNTGDDLTIGRFLSESAYAYEGKCPFIGKIDEVRISNVVYSADWIMLCYMNQKAQDVLVKW